MNGNWKLRVTASLLTDNLAAGLYEDAGDCLAEIWRNGKLASMPNGIWTPGVGEVKISFIDNHPLNPHKKALMVLDHGSGFTDPAIETFCAIGATIEDRARNRKGTHSGAAQKRIGRFAAFALNDEYRKDSPDYNSGFFILTRTAGSGKVTFVQMIPRTIEKQGGDIPVELIDPSAIQMGPLRGIKGSFTAVVIQNSVFRTNEEIRKAMLWRIPRRKELGGHLLIGGKALQPPPLDECELIIQGGNVEVFLNRADDPDSNDGVWISDADTGLRVTTCPRLGTKIPQPFWSRSLTGDIFVRDALANQTSDRKGLKDAFLRGSIMNAARMFLIGHVGEKANRLIGRNTFSRPTSVNDSVMSIAETLKRAFGLPLATANGAGFPVLGGGGGGRKKPGGPTTTDEPTTKSGGPRKHSGGDQPGAKPRIVTVPVRIGEDDFFLSPREMDPRLFAEVDEANGQIIYLNTRTYTGLPGREDQRDEQMLQLIFAAVARYKHQGNDLAQALMIGDINTALRHPRKAQASE